MAFTALFALAFAVSNLSSATFALLARVTLVALLASSAFFASLAAFLVLSLAVALFASSTILACLALCTLSSAISSRASPFIFELTN